MEDKITEKFYVENCLYNSNAVNQNYNTENEKICDCVPHEASDDSMLQTIPKDKQKATTPLIPEESSSRHKRRFGKNKAESEVSSKKEKNQFALENNNKKTNVSDTEETTSSSSSRNTRRKDRTRFVRKASVKIQDAPNEQKVTKKKTKNENKENTKNLEEEKKPVPVIKIKEIRVKEHALEKSEIAAINVLANLSNIPVIRKHDCTFRLPPTHLLGEYLRCENCYTLPNHNKVIRLLVCTETGDFRTISKLERILDDNKAVSSAKNNSNDKVKNKDKEDDEFSSLTEGNSEKSSREEKKTVKPASSAKNLKKTKQSLEKNVEMNKSEVRKYECDLCQNRFTSSFGLKYHKENGHTSEKENVKKPYVCPAKGCNKKYKNNNGLKYHLNHNHTHTAKSRRK